MSFRRFVWYCAVCGAWSALLGWALGALVSPSGGTFVTDLIRSAVLGLCLGICVAFGLSVLDAFWNLSRHQAGQAILRVGAALTVGGVGGLLGAALGQLLYCWTDLSAFFLLGWLLLGLLVGAALGAFEVVASVLRGKDFLGAFRKLMKCLMGGAAGGLIGGALALVLRVTADFVFSDRDTDRLLSPTALGFVALGACIGLLVGLAQVILKEAWVRVEAGFRPGRELILGKDRTVIGRAEGTDIALFGDSGVEKRHAQIVREKGRFYLEELGPTQGTFVNDRRVKGRTPLASGDMIRVGRSLLRFLERRRKTSS